MMMTMMQSYRLPFVCALLSMLLSTATPLTPHSRRAFLASAATAAAAASVAAPTVTNALDMDAFVQQELSKDNATTQLSQDAALCKYGFPSPETGEACIRAGLPTTRMASGVDAFGKADRGDFVRCKQSYQDNGKGEYVKKTVCDGPR